MSKFLTLRAVRCVVALAAWGLAAGSAGAADPGVTDKEIVVGQSATLQGGKDAFGVAVVEGAKLYFDALNASGGIHGRRITLRTLDDEGKGKTAEANAQKLVADGAFVLFGSIGGAPSTGVMKVANELQVPLVGPLAGTPVLRRPHQSMVFPVRAEHRDEFRAMMSWGKSTGLNSVAFLYSDSDVGRQHLENVKIIAAELGMTLSVPIAVKSEITDAEIDATMKKLMELKPGLFMHNGPAKVYQKFVEKVTAAQLRMSFMGVNQGSYQIAKALGPLAQGMVFAQVVPSPWERKRELAREYQDAARKANPKAEFSYGGLEGFMTAKTLAMALRSAGRDLNRSTLIRALEQANFDLGGVAVRFSPRDHEGSRFVDLSLVTRDGRFMH